MFKQPLQFRPVMPPLHHLRSHSVFIERLRWVWAGVHYSLKTTLKRHNTKSGHGAQTHLKSLNAYGELCSSTPSLQTTGTVTTKTHLTLCFYKLTEGKEKKSQWSWDWWKTQNTNYLKDLYCRVAPIYETSGLQTGQWVTFSFKYGK